MTETVFHEVPLAFGTGGIRGKWGEGQGRMNLATARRVAMGYAEYLHSVTRTGDPAISGHSRPLSKPFIVIARDTRSTSPDLENEIVRVLTDCGIRVVRFKGPVPTPVLSFAVRRLAADGGIVVTASHNPPNYNGIKIYGLDGGQAAPSLSRAISAFINSIDPVNSFDSPRGEVEFVPPELVDDYVAAASTQVQISVDSSGVTDVPASDAGVVSSGAARSFEVDFQRFKVAYTPLGGAGIFTVPAALSRLGCEVALVKEQASTNGSFANVPSPNPEEPAALEMAVNLAIRRGCALAIATDPDCDRMGVAVIEPEGSVFVPNGHQIGVLLLDFVLGFIVQGRQAAEKPMIPAGSFTVASVVTTRLFEKVSEEYGVPCIKTLIGFKYIGELITEREARGEGVFLFGAEESLGYLAGSHVRDKDATQAASLFVMMEKSLRGKGSTARQRLGEIMKRHGCHAERLITVSIDGPGGPEKVREVTDILRTNPGAFASRLYDRIPGLPAVPVKVLDFSTGIEYSNGVPISMEPPLPPASLLTLLGGGWSISVRPSGTEPKMKIYLSSWETPAAESQAEKDAAIAAQACQGVLDALEAILGELTGTGLNGPSGRSINLQTGLFR